MTRRAPLPFVAWLVAILAVGVVLALVGFGVIPVEGLALFLFGNVVLLVGALALAALGGAFVGMLVAQRIFSSRGFTPLERSLVDSLARLDEIRDAQREILQRLEKVERR